ncbi:MAG TPA: histidine phosphatase family protein [Sediminispirochaeta sp.]|nr:histidine phosphatase family protein [Sediminispirochaeta sp.]
MEDHFTRLCLVRHGETDWNKKRLIQGITDIPLNEAGRDQARQCAQVLSQDPWDLMYSSPLRRAFETARIIGEEIGFSSRDIKTEIDLQERNFGEAEGMEIFPRKELFHDTEIPGAETKEELQTRATYCLEKIARRHRGKRIVIVTHGGLIAGAIERLSEGRIPAGIEPVKNTSLTLLQYNNSWEVLYFNQLSPDLETAVDRVYSGDQ